MHYMSYASLYKRTVGFAHSPFLYCTVLQIGLTSCAQAKGSSEETRGDSNNDTDSKKECRLGSAVRTGWLSCLIVSIVIISIRRWLRASVFNGGFSVRALVRAFSESF